MARLVRLVFPLSPAWITVEGGVEVVLSPLNGLGVRGDRDDDDCCALASRS